MLQIRPSEKRGHANHGWLDTHFTFSFDQYYDPDHVQFRSLRVLNEDVVAPGQGFGMHPHRDMEILTWILEGSLEHRDSMGTGAVIRPGELQHMTAGTGVMHSEFNPSPKEPVHLLQIWITPERKGLNRNTSSSRSPTPTSAASSISLRGQKGRSQFVRTPTSTLRASTKVRKPNTRSKRAATRGFKSLAARFA
jgi:redox-sensitive bicupin YhaK (pirin superfamily)